MPRLGIPGGKQLHPVELHGVLDLHLLHVVENTDKEKYYSFQEGGRGRNVLQQNSQLNE
jgi:hypothetical protein